VLGKYNLSIVEHKHPSAIKVLAHISLLGSYLAVDSIDILCKILLMNDILFFLCEDIKLIFGVFEPWMTEYFHRTESLSRVDLQQRVDQVNCMLSQLGLLLGLCSCVGGGLSILVLSLIVRVGVVHIVFPVDDQVMQLLHARCFERHGAYEHGIEANTCTPHINLETLIALIFQDLWGYIGRGTTLLTHALSI
jgi:hypothetical protein